MYAIHTDSAPETGGPFSQGASAARTVFVSAQAGIDREAGTLISDDAYVQAVQAIRNIEAILAATNLELEDVAKVGIFLTDATDREAVYKACGELFPKPRPAVSAVVVSELTGKGKVEIEAIAVR